MKRPDKTRGLVLAASAGLGALCGVLVLHPVTMVVYWFEFRPDVAGASSLWRFVAHRMSIGFTSGMLPMSAVFAALGTLLGLAVGATILALQHRLRLVHRLERELSRNVDALIRAGESETIEFKASARWDHAAGKPSRAIEAATVRTIAGFFNHRGGSLLLGVADDGSIVGLEPDYATLYHKNRDGFERLVIGFVEDAIGADACPLIHVVFHTVKSKDVCQVVVEAAPRPMYVRVNDAAHYYVRTGNSTRQMDVDEAVEHIALQRVRRRVE